jgi:hypothetical protein
MKWQNRALSLKAFWSCFLFGPAVESEFPKGRLRTHSVPRSVLYGFSTNRGAPRKDLPTSPFYYWLQWHRLFKHVPNLFGLQNNVYSPVIRTNTFEETTFKFTTHE